MKLILKPATAVAALLGLAALAPASAAPLLVYTTGDPRGVFFDTSVSGSFTDIYTFSVLNTSDVSASLSSTPYSDLTLTDLGIFKGTAELTSFSQGQHDMGLGAGTNMAVLDPGTYSLHVTGTFASSDGAYTGVLAVSAVPLPTSVALFGLALLGLGGAGLVRRKWVAAPSA